MHLIRPPIPTKQKPACPDPSKCDDKSWFYSDVILNHPKDKQYIAQIIHGRSKDLKLKLDVSPDLQKSGWGYFIGTNVYIFWVMYVVVFIRIIMRLWACVQSVRARQLWTWFAAAILSNLIMHLIAFPTHVRSIVNYQILIIKIKRPTLNYFMFTFIFIYREH